MGPAILIFTRKGSDRMLSYARGVSCVVQWVLCLPNGQGANSANSKGSPYGCVKLNHVKSLCLDSRRWDREVLERGGCDLIKKQTNANQR